MIGAEPRPDERMPPLVGDLLARMARENPDGRIFTHLTFNGAEPRQITCGDLYRRACGVAGMLADLGLRGRPVLLLHPAGEDFAPAFFGTLLAGAVAVPVPLPQFDSHYLRLERIAADCSPGAVLSIDGMSTRLLARLPAGSSLRECPWLTEPGGHGRHRYEPPSVEGSEIALLQYTSGSTSEPRGVAVTHANLAHNLEMLRRAFQPAPGARIVSWLPHFHDMGLIVGVMGPLACAGESILMAPLSFLQRPMRWLETISEYRAAVSGGPNFAYDLCVKWAARGAPPALDLSCWRHAFVGAEPIRFATLQAFAACFQASGFEASALTPCYGMAEATLMVTCKPAHTLPTAHALARAQVEAGLPAASPGAPMLTLTGCGYPAPETELRIVDPRRRVALERGEVGELWVSGPQVAPGYWTRSDDDPFGASLADSGEGRYLRTGDLAFLAADGELVFVDRIKDVIIVNGQNHVCHDLELTAGGSHPLLSPDGCVAVAFPTSGGTHLAVIAELARDEINQAEDAAKAVRSALFTGHGLAVRTIAFVAPRKLSRTTSGKLQRRLNGRRLVEGSLQSLASFGDAVPPTPPTVPEPVAR